MGRLFDARTLVHLVMFSFGAVSVQNVATYFVSAGHSANAAWTLGIALGLALLTVSMMLTHIDAQDRGAFWWLLLAGTVLAIVSGGIQSAEYAKHLGAWAAMGLGYGLPVGGEILLAFATAAYVEAKRRHKIRMATAGTTERIAECVAEALSDVDVTKVRKYVERRIDGIVRAQVDAVARQLAPVEQPERPLLEGDETDNHPVPEPQAFGPQNLALANRVRADQVAQEDDERKRRILAYLRHHQPQGTSAIARQLGVHRDTARKACQALEGEGKIQVMGRKWAIVTTNDMAVSPA